jgi:3-methyladenine DNA glycosylase AlkD
LHARADPADALNLQRFFKSGPGEYGEGDVLAGVRVPVLRKLASTYHAAPRRVVLGLLRSRVHEERMLALLIMIRQYAAATPTRRQRIHADYLAHTAYVNNWDLVDLSAPHLVGAHLVGRDRSVLLRLAKSSSLWERRIAMLATLHFIRERSYNDALTLAEHLLTDSEDLIHKATGWMLREIGHRDRAVEEAFLNRHAQSMPRTMLRYAIERFDEPTRQHYLRL